MVFVNAGISAIIMSVWILRMVQVAMTNRVDGISIHGWSGRACYKGEKSRSNTSRLDTYVAQSESFGTTVPQYQYRDWDREGMTAMAHGVQAFCFCVFRGLHYLYTGY